MYIYRSMAGTVSQFFVHGLMTIVQLDVVLKKLNVWFKIVNVIIMFILKWFDLCS